MPSSRRNFFSDLVAGGSLAAAIATMAEAQTGAAQSKPDPFWSNFYNNVDPTGRGRDKKTPQRPAVPSKAVRYLYAPPDGSSVRWVDDLKREELLDHSGDVTVSVVLNQFRPAGGDVEAIQKQQSAQLRVDCVQTRRFMNVLAPAAWVALASLYTDSAGKLPSLEQLGFQNSTAMSGDNKIVLPGGTGKFALNVSQTKKESTLHKILKDGTMYAGLVAPILGFPAISIPAAKAFTAIYSALEERAAILMNGPLIDAAATQQAALAEDISSTHLPLVSGNYVMVADENVERIRPVIERLRVNQGYLVDSNQPSGPANRREIKDVTYLSVKVTVEPLKVQAGAAAAPAASADSSAAKKSSSTATKSSSTKKN